MDRGLVGRRRIRGNPALPSEMYVPSNLQLMRQELWPDRHLCQHRRSSRVPNIGEARVFLAELPDTDDVEIQGFPSTLIGVSLHFGVLPRSPPPHGGAAEFMAQSQLEQENSFLLLHRMPPPSLIIHEPAFLWAWPLDAVTVTPSASPLLPSVEPTSVLSLVGLYSCKCTPHKGSGGGGEGRVGGCLLRLNLGDF